MKIVASVTTTPKRIEKIKNTLISIINQYPHINLIYLVVPYVSYSNNEVYIIPSLIYDFIPKIEIIRCDDYGPISKIVALLPYIDISEDVWILTFDDDIIYEDSHVNNLIKSIKNINFNEVYGLLGFNIDKNNNFIKSNIHSVVDILEGSSSILYHRSIFKDDFQCYVSLLLNNINCRYSDDIIICNYLSKYKVKKTLEFLFSTDIRKKYIVSYSSAKDSLSNGKDGIILEKELRYKRVLQILKDLDIYYLH